MNDLSENQIRILIPIILLQILSTEVEQKLQKISKICDLLVIWAKKGHNRFGFKRGNLHHHKVIYHSYQHNKFLCKYKRALLRKLQKNLKNREKSKKIENFATFMVCVGKKQFCGKRVTQFSLYTLYGYTW